MTFSNPGPSADLEAPFDQGYGTAESWAERRLVDLRDAVREEPIKTTLIAMAAGALLGRIFLR